MSGYLITGFPGFTTRHLIRQLLAEEQSVICWVLLADKQDPAWQGFLNALPERLHESLRAIEGDVAALDFGLSGAEYRRLSEGVERVHHVAHETTPGLRRSREELSIAPMREVLEFCRSCSRLERLVVHSSAKVSGDRHGLILEQELNQGQAFTAPIEEALACSELMARRNMEKLPISVLRPTHIVADSETGEMPETDALQRLVSLSLKAAAEATTTLSIRNEAPVQLVPVNYVVRAATALGRARGAQGRTFHLADRDPPSARRLFELVAAAVGKRLPSTNIVPPLTRALLKTPGVQLFLERPLELLDVVGAYVHYDTRNTDEFLGDQIQCPPIQAYLPRVIDAVRLRGEAAAQEERRS